MEGTVVPETPTLTQSVELYPLLGPPPYRSVGGVPSSGLPLSVPDLLRRDTDTSPSFPGFGSLRLWRSATLSFPYLTEALGGLPCRDGCSTKIGSLRVQSEERRSVPSLTCPRQKSVTQTPVNSIVVSHGGTEVASVPGQVRVPGGSGEGTLDDEDRRWSRGALGPRGDGVH